MIIAAFLFGGAIAMYGLKKDNDKIIAGGGFILFISLTVLLGMNG